MPSAHVYVHLLTWNDRRYLPDLFESFQDQTYPNFTVRILDNGSTDGTLEYLQQHFPKTLVARNVKNAGFAEGHNQLIRYTLDHLPPENEDAHILIMNSDMILSPTLIERLAQAADEHEDIVGGFQPKLYRAFAEQVGDEVLEDTMKSDILDTTGLSVARSWRMSDRGAGELDKGQYDDQQDIFAPTGTIALYPVAVVKNLLMNGEFFDKQFFAYREDCDLAWRFRKRGWQARFVPEATAYHYRGMYGAQKQSWWQRVVNRKGQRPFFAALSTRNQLFVLMKNLTFGSFLLSLPWLVFHEGGRVFYAMIFESHTRKRLIAMWAHVPEMLRRRKAIKEAAAVPESELRRYIS